MRRNLFGPKPTCVLICLATVMAVSVVRWSRYPHAGGFAWGAAWRTSTLQSIQAGALGLSLIALTGWLFVVRLTWVKEAGDLHALTLTAHLIGMSQLGGEIMIQGSPAARLILRSVRSIHDKQISDDGP